MNVSIEGLFMRADVLPAVGDEICVRFYFAGRKVQGRGTVRWTTDRLPDGGKGFGVHLELPGRDFIEFFGRLLRP
jgi:hypothetical protein